MSWFVLSVKEGQENEVSKKLQQMSFQVFNPVVSEVKYWSNQQKVIESPLFKTHVFVNIPEKYRRIVFALSGVNGYVLCEGKPAKVYNEEIETIKDWMDNKMHDLVLLSKLMSRNEVSMKKWLQKNNAGVKWIGQGRVNTLIEEMDVIVKNKLAKVV